MSLPHKFTQTIAGLALAIFVGVFAIEQAAAEDPPFDPIRAPFTCGTEWSGVTRSGHGLNNWNLDINSTERTYAVPQYDLGAPLLAQADGTIVWIGWHVSAGTYVEIDYGQITVRYIHLVDGSVPEGLETGSSVTEGELFGLLGDSGNATHAHLHLEYFDSRDYNDARAYLLPSANQIQIAMDGELIDPGETFVSTNCDGNPPPATSTTSTTTTTTTAPPHPFRDVDPDSYAYFDVGLLYDLGITTGTADDAYSPGDDVTREQMAAFLGRTWLLFNPSELETAGNAVSAHGLIEPEPYPFDDVDPESFAYEHIALLHELGITTGTGARTYSPNDIVDREQMAAFLGRLYGKLHPAAEAVLGPTFPFEDVDPRSYALAHIDLIWRVGITTGTSPTSYSPADSVDREQMAAFLARLYRLTAQT